MNIQYQVVYYPYTLESFNSTNKAQLPFHSDLEGSALQLSQFRPLAIKNERQFPFPGGRESLFQLEYQKASFLMCKAGVLLFFHRQKSSGVLAVERNLHIWKPFLKVYLPNQKFD